MSLVKPLWERQQGHSNFEGVYRVRQHLVQVRIDAQSQHEVAAAWVWSPTSRRWNWFTGLWANECASTGLGRYPRPTFGETVRRQDVEWLLRMVRRALLGELDDPDGEPVWEE